MKHAWKILRDMPEKEERRVIDCTTSRPLDMQDLKANVRREIENQTDFHQNRKTGVVVQKKSRTKYFSKDFKTHITRKQRAIKIFFGLYEPIYFRDKDSSQEHHDLIVGKDDQGII